MSIEVRGSEAVYVGPDWLVYVADRFEYNMSEFVAPGCLVGARGERLSLTLRGQDPVEGPCLVHGMGVWSAMAANAAAVIYADPLTARAIAVQRRVGTSAFPLSEAHSVAPDAAQLSRLAQGLAAPQEVVAWVDCVLARARGTEALLDLDPRLKSLRDDLHANPDGRVPLARLAQRTRMSADHLRQTFRRQIGVSLSGYQSWVRLYGMARTRCDELRSGHRAAVADVLLSAGFYDSSHGSRVIKRYFDLKPSEVMAPEHFIDCRIVGSCRDLRSFEVA